MFFVAVQPMQSLEATSPDKCASKQLNEMCSLLTAAIELVDPQNIRLRQSIPLSNFHSFIRDWSDSIHCGLNCESIPVQMDGC